MLWLQKKIFKIEQSELVILFEPERCGFPIHLNQGPVDSEVSSCIMKYFPTVPRNLLFCCSWAPDVLLTFSLPCDTHSSLPLALQVSACGGVNWITLLHNPSTVPWSQAIVCQSNSEVQLLASRAEFRE